GAPRPSGQHWRRRAHPALGRGGTTIGTIGGTTTPSALLPPVVGRSWRSIRRRLNGSGLGSGVQPVGQGAGVSQANRRPTPFFGAGLLFGWEEHHASSATLGQQGVALGFEPPDQGFVISEGALGIVEPALRVEQGQTGVGADGTAPPL